MTGEIRVQREPLHETHTCRDCGCVITIPYAKPDPRDGPATFGQQESVRDVDRWLSRRIDAATEPRGAA